ncbi:hypothetical protein BDW62DRAFT_204466 [Aspergillus aurantiobrunneus]
MNSNEKEPLLIEPSPDASSSEASLGFQKGSEGESPRLDKLSKPPRKRSRIACTWCRDRKVRCDASSHGVPCTNCELDQQECVVHSAAQDRNTRSKKPPCSRRQPYPSPTPSTLKSSIFQTPEASSRSSLISQSWNEAGNDQNPWATPSLPSSAGSVSSTSAQSSTISDVFYSSHTFLKLPGFSEIPQDDTQHLNLKGCFRVPSGATLDEFVRKYFLYVHPCLPIINEAEFWQMYYHQSGTGEDNRVSLFTFQAMLFASSAFVSPKAIKSAGFSDARTARNTLYTRAKLLHDIGCERSPLSTAQGSLLLTYQSSSSDLHAGSLWLSIAIQNAIVYNALHPTRSPKTDNIKKRIWWSILLRDRIIPLGLRCHPQITPQTLDLDLTGLSGGGDNGGGVLGEKDLEDEIGASEVYDAETKRLLARVVSVRCELGVCLGDVLGIVHSAASSVSPSNAFGSLSPSQRQAQSQTASPKQTLSTKQQVATCKANLLRWSTKAKATLGAVVNSHTTHESVGLYFGLTFFCYHAARLALCNVEALTLQLNKPHARSKQAEREEESDHERVQYELEDATGCITDTIKRFLAQGVAHHLPISTIALAAHPLLLSALDVKLSSTKSQSATRKRRFRYYANLMQVFQHRYDGTDTVAAFIQQTLQLADYILPQARRPLSPSSSSKGSQGSGPSQTQEKEKQKENANTSVTCSSWSELFAEFPKLYLRLVLALDHAFSRGYYPTYTEIHELLGEGDGGGVTVIVTAGLGARVSSTAAPVASSPSVSGLGRGHGPGPVLTPGLTNLYTLLDSEQQQQHRHQPAQHHGPQQNPSLGTLSVPDPLIIPGYSPMLELDSQYAYPAQLASTHTQVSFGHQDYGFGMYQFQEHGMLEENGTPEFLNLGRSGSELDGYSAGDGVVLPVGVGDEGCANG